MACFQYYSYLQDTFRKESETYLHEVTRKIGDNLNQIFDNNFAILHTMASSMELSEVSQISELQDMLKQQQQYWDFENIFVVDENGMSYDLNEQAVYLTLDDSTRKNILAGNDSVSPTQMIDNKEYMIFGIPLNNVQVDGKKMVALAAGYDSSSFDQVLTMSAFSEQVYSQIVTKSGTMITRPSSPYAIQSGYNILSTLRKANIDSKGNLEQVLEDIQQNKEGQLGFELEGVHRYMIYSPINPENWYLFTFVPAQAVNAKSDIALTATVLICGVLILVFATLIATIYYIFRRNKLRLEQIAYVDSITGGNTIDRFYDLAGEALDKNPTQQYALVYSNIEKFKVLNEQLGREG